MGDTISIRFVNDNDKSVVLFSHWDGQCFLKEAKKYAKELRIEMGFMCNKNAGPLERLEPQTVMVDFIRHLTLDGTRAYDLYLGVDENDGDNSDNGHYDIDLATSKAIGE